jgi:hypothetical protein
MSAQGAKIDKKTATGKGSPGHTSLMILFSVTIFVSASLLFLVEPMFAKFILPLFGSTPAVWTGSMMFFQMALLIGYLYVHATTAWLGARKQAVLHLVVVLLPLLVLPLAVPADDWAPSSQANPIFLLLGLLLVSVGLPFFAISTTNPLVQKWLADTDHPAARDPYFLYRASNLGSIIGLLGYPLLVERELTLDTQGIVWSVGYGLLLVLVFASAVALWRSPRPSSSEGEQEEEPLSGDPVSGGGSPQNAPLVDPQAERLTLWRRLRWVGLTFVPSSLMLGVTAFITTDITPIPLLWVIPLSLYLFSFVIVFSPSQRMPDLIHKIMVGALPVMMAVLVLTILIELRNPYWLLILLHLLGFFVVAVVLHGEVARDRPSARHLTEFYLWVSVGGFLGGVFNALIAPVAFDTVVEYPLAIILACVFVPGLVLSRLLQSDRASGEEGRSQEDEAASGDDEEVPETLTSSGSRTSGSRRLDLALDLALPLALGLAMWGISTAIDTYFPVDYIDDAWQIMLGLAVGLCLWFAYSTTRPIRFGLGIAAILIVGTVTAGAGALYEDRSFFGVYRVTGDDQVHTLVFGETNHGSQVLGVQPPEPSTYYHPTGPVGQVFDALPEEVTSRPAVVGLGTGTMACYNKPGQQMTFYEIDPLVDRMAHDNNLFTYLRDCPGENNVVLGDARLSLGDAPDGGYGVIAVDAFSSDAIPVHLMTREAIDLYFDKLQSDGVLVMHISNRHLELEPVLGNVAQDAGLVCRAQYDQENENTPGKFVSHWVVMGREEEDLGNMADDARWSTCETDADSPVWTDDYSNLLSTFVWQ